MIAHLSYSSISSYLTCGRAWKYHYIDKLPEPTTPALLFGSAFHNTIEEIVKAKTIGDSHQDAKEAFKKHFSAEVESAKEVDWQDTSFADQLKLADRILKDDDIITTIHSLRAKVDKDNIPMIERKVVLSVPGVDVPILGFIDIILDDGTPSDFKTASKMWSQAQAEKQMQCIPCERHGCAAYH